MMNEVTIDRDYPDKDGEAIIDVHDGKIYQVFSNTSWAELCCAKYRQDS